MKPSRKIGLKIINLLPSSIKWFLFDLNIFQNRLRIDFELTRRIHLAKKAKILIIGANDGLSFDNLFNCLNKNKVSGLLVEPSSRYFSQLIKNSEPFPKLKSLKVALSKTNSFLDLYQLNELGLKNMADWGRGIGSFSKEHLLKFDGVIEEFIELELVEGKTFKSLIEEYDLYIVEYLQIDTEGFDAEIIKMIDFKTFFAAVIKFEVANLSISESLEVQEILKNQGYYLVRLGGDMVAFSRSVNLFFK